MIKDYETLKKHCNVNYKINDTNIKIGDLSDNQLNISKHILNRKITLNKQEKQQLDALNFAKDNIINQLELLFKRKDEIASPLN